MKKRAAIYLAGLLCCLCVYALGDRLSRGESQRLAFPDQGFSLRVPEEWLFEAEEPEAGGQLLGWAGTEDGTAFLCISARLEATGGSLSDRTEEELAALVKEWQEAGYEQTGTSRAGGVTFLTCRYQGADGYPWITYTTWADGMQLTFDFSADAGGAEFRSLCRQIMSTFTWLS